MAATQPDEEWSDVDFIVGGEDISDDNTPSRLAVVGQHGPSGSGVVAAPAARQKQESARPELDRVGSPPNPPKTHHALKRPAAAKKKPVVKPAATKPMFKVEAHKRDNAVGIRERSTRKQVVTVQRAGLSAETLRELADDACALLNDGSDVVTVKDLLESHYLMAETLFKT